jgi:iron complex outermembrane receptor protein
MYQIASGRRVVTKFNLLFAPLLAASILPAYAQAQSAEGQANGAEADGGIADILVYGQKRSAGESAQKVPISITALDPGLLRSANTVNITDLGALAPNVQTTTAGTTPGFPNFSIRGIGINSSIRSADPSVNVVQDGMVVAYLAGSLASTFDLESVEVLRGPQGVLFGRNATGGAISLRTRRPQRDFQALADISYGNFNTLDANASVEGALGSDAVLGKLAVLYRRTDGFYKNTNEGTWIAAPGNPTGIPFTHPTGRLGQLDQLTIKPTFVFGLDDTTTLTMFGQYQRYNDEQTSFPRNFVPALGGAAVALQTYYGFTPTASGYDTNIYDGGHFRLRAGHVIGELVNEFGSGAKLTTVAAWRHVDLNTSVNFYGGPMPIFYLVDNPERSSQYSLESRLNLPLADGRAELTAGLFYLRYDMFLREDRRILSNATVLPNLDYTYTRGTFNLETTAIAAFANIDWRATDALTISLGGRFSRDKKNFRGAPLTPCGAILTGCPQIFTTISKRWNDFSPRAVVNFQAAERVMLYASYTKGFRSGNFNSRATSAGGFTPASPESVDSYEIGMKSDLLGGKVRLNIAGFIEDYKDIQQVFTLNFVNVPPSQTLVNAASARIKGVEGELIVQPFPALQLQANVGYTKAQFRTFNVAVPGIADPTKLEFARIPELTATVAANLSLPLAENRIEGRVSYDYRSHTYPDLANTPDLRVGGYGLLNANLTYVAENWSLGVFGRNLANTVYAEGRGRFNAYAEWGGQPRTFGVRLTANMQ